MTDHDCDWCRALHRMEMFLDNELPETEADALRAHLNQCAGCVDCYDAEQVVREAIRRCVRTQAPASLRIRISTLRITYGEQ